MSWIIYTITATILQTYRNLEQKYLNQKLDSLTVCWSRFILPLPLALIVVIKTSSSVNLEFITHCFITAIFQVAGNIFLLKTFKLKNFSIGITFYKTEVFQALLIGFLFFNQSISFIGFIAIILTTVGVILMSGLVFNGGIVGFIKSLQNKAAFYGLTTGFCFSISAFNLKFSSSALTTIGYSNIKSGIIVLMWVICLQNIFFVTIKFYQKRLKKDLTNLLSLENKSAFLKTSIFSFLGSICWFVAFSLGEVVYVKAVGQTEVILAILVSHFTLRESHNIKEIWGIVLTALGIITLIIFH
jgi:uncharacterized membrane protein